MTDTPSPEEIFGQRIRRRREDLGISLRALADRMRQQGHRWHQTTVARTEHGDRPVRLNEAVALAGILRTPLTELLSSSAEEDQDSLKERLVVLEGRLAGANDTLAEARYRANAAQKELTAAEHQVMEAQRRLHDEIANYGAASARADSLAAEVAALRSRLAERGLPLHPPENLYEAFSHYARLDWDDQVRMIWRMYEQSMTPSEIGELINETTENVEAMIHEAQDRKLI